MSSKKRDKQNFCQKNLFFGGFFVSICDAESTGTSLETLARRNATNYAVVSVGNGYAVGKKTVGATAGQFFLIIVC